MWGWIAAGVLLGVAVIAAAVGRLVGAWDCCTGGHPEAGPC